MPLSEFSVEAMPQLPSVPQRWLRVAVPVAGESLTSLLCRQARLWGISLQSLLKDVDPAVSRLMPDLDLAPSENLISRIAMRMGLSVQEVQETTFRNNLETFINLDNQAKLASHRWRMSHLPWILPFGWQINPPTSLKEGGGIPYCPACTAEAPNVISPLVNRLATTVACPRHQIWLHDACPTCNSRSTPSVSPLIPGKVGDRVGIRCEACEPSLPTKCPDLVSAENRVLVLQELILNGVQTGEVPVPQLGTYPTVAFLGGLRFILFIEAWLREQGVCLPPARYNKVFPLVERRRCWHQGPFETRSIEERIQRMKGAAWVLAKPLDRWPLLQQLCSWPPNIPKSWRHPWECISPHGEVMQGGAWGQTEARRFESPDVAGVRAFFDLVEGLGFHPVRVQGLLGNITPRRYQRWRNQPSTRIPLESQRRMEFFLRLWKCLRGFLGDDETAKNWLLNPNQHPIFGGREPMDGFSGEGTLHKFEAAVSMFEAL